MSAPIAKSSRRVFIATDLVQGDLVKEFATVLSKYSQAESPDDAEFVILDLDHRPHDWVIYIQARRVPGETISHKAVVPCLLWRKGDMSGQPTPIQQLIEQSIAGAFGTRLRLCQTEDALVADLEWIECMIPFTKTKISAEMEKKVRDIVLRASNSLVET